MSLFKRSSSRNWYYKLYPPGGGQVLFGSTGTDDKAKAQEFHDRLKADLWDQAKLGHKPRYTWNEAVIRYVADRDGISSLETTKTHLRWLDRHLSGVELRAIDRAMIHTIAHAKRSEQQVLRTLKGEKPRGKTVSAGTVNRVIGVLNAVLNAAVEWEWIDRAPVVKRAKVAAKRVRWLTPEEATALLAVLPVHLADMAQFSLETGLRRSNVTGLQWSQVDLVRRLAWVHPDQAKARKAIAVPLNAEAAQIVRKRLGKHSTHVFSFRGQPIRQVSTKAWYAALKRAGITDFRWHDLRHTWASWHVQNGTPLFALQEMAGWETEKMLSRYAHLAVGHLAVYADALSFHGTITAHLPAARKQLGS